MTREETKKAIEIMQAYVDGKHVELKAKGQDTISWREAKDPIWDFWAFEYRIKPEKHILRPYTFEEMCDAVKKHGLIVKAKDHKEIFIFCGFDEHNVFYKDSVCESYKEFLDNNMWLDDNSPCGVIEEE